MLINLDVGVSEAGACVVFWLELGFGTVDDFPMFVGRVLRFGRERVSVLGKYVTDVAFHGESACSACVVP